MSFESNLVFALVLHYYSLLLVKNWRLAPLSQPIRRITKTNRDLLARVFPRWKLNICICFDFWLVHFLFLFLFWLVTVITLDLVLRHSFENRLALEKGRRLARSPLEPSRNDVWVTSAEIPYWWCVTDPDVGSASDWLKRNALAFQSIRSTTKIWIVHVIGMEILRSLLRRRFARAQVATSPDVGCFNFLG